jgi:putative ABC transport system permease protein
MRTMGIRLLAGRAFEAGDFGDSVARVVIISKSLATKLWPGENPIGRQLTAGNSKRRTVVGVTADVRHQGLDANVGLQFYVPEREWGSADDHIALVVRTRGDPARVAAAVRAAVASVDPMQPITSVKTMDAVVSASTARRQLALTLFVAFAVLALVLAAAGIYGVLAAAVAERMRELGLRSALGAAPSDLLALVMRASLTMAVAGVVVGAAGTVVLTRFIHSLLFGIGDMDPLTLVGAAMALLVIACAAAVVPAWRAIRVDPIVTLRGD